MCDHNIINYYYLSSL